MLSAITYATNNAVDQVKWKSIISFNLQGMNRWIDDRISSYNPGFRGACKNINQIQILIERKNDIYTAPYAYE